MNDELYPLGHEADETMYSAGDVRQLLNDERARSYAAVFAAGLEQAAKVCDERSRMWAQGEFSPAAINKAMEAAACDAAIRRLAAPPAAGLHDGGKVDA